MKFVPAITTGIKDLQVRQLFEFVLRLLGSVVQYDLYKLTTVWHVPFKLSVPTTGLQLRTTPPAVVRLGRAVAIGDEITPVYTGSVLWTWGGDGSVTIQDVEGLVAGVKYELTFEVVSN